MDKLENSKNEIIEPRPELILSGSEIKNFEPMDLVSVSGEKLTNFKNESRSILESANLNIGLSAEKIDKIQKESGIVEELKAIDSEAEKIVNTAPANQKLEDDKKIFENPNDEPFFKTISDDVDVLMKSKNSPRARVFSEHVEKFAKDNPEKVKAYLKYGEEHYADPKSYQPAWYEQLKHVSQFVKLDNSSEQKEEVKVTENVIDKGVENTENVKVAENKVVEEKEEEEELPYSKDFIKNIQNLYFQEQSRLEDLGVSGQTLQVRLGEYKKRILEPMLEKESEENEALNNNEANITKKNDISINQEDQVSKDNNEGDSQIDAVGDDNEEMSEKKSNKTEGIVKKVSYEEWTKTLNPKLLPNAKEYENLSPTYFVDDKNNHFVAFNEGGKKMVDKLYLNENNRVYVMPVDPLSIENK